MIFRHKFILIIISLCLVYQLSAKLIINEVMFNPDGSEYDNEFIELYNNSEDTFDLSEVTIGDNDEDDKIVPYPNSDKITIAPYSYALILDSSYPESDLVYETIIPDSVTRFLIEDGSFGKYGFSNSYNETVFLKRNSEIIDSVTYKHDLIPGFTFERILFAENNWNSSQLLNGTPGIKNSITPLNNDLAINYSQSKDTLYLDEQNITLNFSIKNQGIETKEELYFELRKNNELIQDQVIEKIIGYQDSLLLNLELKLDPGFYFYELTIVNQHDENLSNNKDSLYIFYTEAANSKLVLNEFLRKNSTGNSDWLELYNPNSLALPLNIFKISDSEKEICQIFSNKQIRANDFIVIAKDSSLLKQNSDLADKIIITTDFPNFNNDDAIYLYDYNNIIIDSLAYKNDDWSEAVDFTLEKINPNLSSNKIRNWNISTCSKGTPARQNSIYTALATSGEKFKLTILNKFLTPDNNGEDDNLGINLNFPSGFIYFTAIIYNKKGQKIRTIFNNEYVNGEETLFWNLQDKNKQTLPTGAYILFAKVRGSSFSEKTFKKVFYIVK